jgi:hypothetical protein
VNPSVERPARSRKDLLAGLTFVVLGGAFALGATAFEVGDPARPGPGFYPLVVGVLVVVLGVVIILRPATEESLEPITAPSWRATVMIVAGLAAFALLVRGAGLVPATFVAAFLASFASRSTGPLAALAMATGLTVLSVLIFVIGLSLRLPLLGTWFPRL